MRLLYVLGVIVLIGISGVWWHRTQWSCKRAVERGLSYVIAPLVKWEHSILTTVHKYVCNVKSYRTLAADYVAVCQERDALYAETIMWRAIHSLYEEVQELIEFKERYCTQNALLTHIILKTISPVEHTALIDKGASHGVTAGMIVIWRNCIVGRVLHVMPRYSKIVFLTDPRCKIAVYCEHTHTNGIHSGINETANTIVHYSNHFDQLEPNDLIFSSGVGGVFPRGFAVGRINYATNNGLSHNVHVHPCVDISTISYCYLIKTALDNES